MSELTVLVKRCLAFGVAILPFQQGSVFRKYNDYKMPDEQLAVLKKPELEKYVKALYLSNQEMARDWAKGHEMLMQLGFERKERKEGHRCFVSLSYAESKELEKQ